MRVPKDNPFDTAWPALAGALDRFVRGIPEQELNLLQLATADVTQLRARA